MKDSLDMFDASNDMNFESREMEYYTMHWNNWNQAISKENANLDPKYLKFEYSANKVLALIV